MNPARILEEKREREIPYIFENTRDYVWDKIPKGKNELGRLWVAEKQCIGPRGRDGSEQMRKLTNIGVETIMTKDLHYDKRDPHISDMQETTFKEISKFFCGGSYQMVIKSKLPIPRGGRRRTFRRQRRRATRRR